MSLKQILKSRLVGQELLVTPRYEQYLARNHNILLSQEISEFVVKELSEPQRNRRMTFSASARGSCPRAQVFQFTPVRPIEKMDSQLHAIFHQGTFMHLKWQALLLAADILDEVEVSCVWEKYDMSGTIDGMGEVPADHPLRAEHDRYGWELKSINSRGFAWVIEKGPNKNHLLQIHAYMLATDVHIWSLVYENKDTQEWKEFIVNFDPAIADEVEKELAYLNKSVKDKTLPPVLSECAKRQGAFKRCQFAHTCLSHETWPSEEPRRLKLG